MPPFGAQPSDDQVAALLSFIRNQWGNKGLLVSADQLNR
jgi:hypothetical protein